MKILIAHNRYMQAGGEDVVVRREAEMLARRGHSVEKIQVDNDHILGVKGQVSSAIRSFYSRPSRKMVASVIASYQPDILHVHNFLPTLSPSVFFASSDAKVPVVQTLHNYRLLCANAQFFRENKPCELCLSTRSFIPGVRYSCYRDSRIGSAIVGSSMAIHDSLGTWRHRIDRYIALTTFAANKFAQFRVPPEKIRVKPNFAEDLGVGKHLGNYLLFVGRLTEEKGIRTLLRADAVDGLPLPLIMVGDGPLRDDVQQASERVGSKIRVFGLRSSEQTTQLMKDASALVVPSIWYEGFPMVIVEALAVGLPVIASRIGGLPDIFEDGTSGLLFNPSSESSLIEVLENFSRHKDQSTMSAAARKRYTDHYGEEENYRQLMRIYQELT